MLYNINSRFEETDPFSSEYTPTCSDPFCNDTETKEFNSDYSDVIPTFFFRTQRQSLKPSSFETLSLKVYYNLCGVLLSCGLALQAVIYLMMNIFMFLFSFSSKNPVGNYYSIASDQIIASSFKIIACICSSALIVFLGSKLSKISIYSLFEGKKNINTYEIITFFMSGLFITSLNNICDIISEHFSLSDSYANMYSGSTQQIILSVIYGCIVMPVSQSFTFQGIILRNMSRASQRFGIIITSVLCALSCMDAVYILPQFFMSILLSKIAIRYNSILPGMIIHMTLCISNTIITLYGELFLDSDLIIKIIWTGIMFITGAAFMAISVIKYPVPVMETEQKSRTLKLILLSPGFLTTIITYLYMIIEKFL